MGLIGQVTLTDYPAGGIDGSGLIRRILTDPTGNLTVTGPTDQTKVNNPIKATLDNSTPGKWNPSELLELVVNQLQIISYYLRDLPLMLNTGKTYSEEDPDFAQNPDRQG